MENKSFTQNVDFGFNNPNNQDLPPKPNNYLPLSIVSTVIGFCSPLCIGLIIGVIAIVFSTQVDSKYGYKDYLGAAQSSKNAKILSLIALVIGVGWIIYSIISFTRGDGIIMMERYKEIIEQYIQ